MTTQEGREKEVEMERGEEADRRKEFVRSFASVIVIRPFTDAETRPFFVKRCGPS